MLINPTYGAAGGSEPIEYFLYDKEIADGSSDYITVNLDKTIPNNTPLVVCIYDPEENITQIATCPLSYYSVATEDITVFVDGTSNRYSFTLTPTTIKLYQYNFGNWRKIYCRISRMIPNDGYIYGT